MRKLKLPAAQIEPAFMNGIRRSEHPETPAGESSLTENRKKEALHVLLDHDLP
ncbi:hypothetical protein JW906_15285 [bacterium]|nr:hypothetical protein [bacterium]